MLPLKLIVGLGNPGPTYARTRHNVGEAWVRSLASAQGINLAPDSRFKGEIGRGTISGQDVRLLVPTTFMNLSGEAVGAVARFYKLDVQEILVAYDEMAFEPGIVRLKAGGGDNGHNGLKSIRSSLGNNGDYHRLRIGVGHPGDKNRVINYLTRVAIPSAEEVQIEDALRMSESVLKAIVSGDWQAAMNVLHLTGTTPKLEEDK